MNDDLVGWGLGWGLQRTSNGVGFWQWGDNDHYQAITLGFPEHGNGVVIMTNGFKGQPLIKRVMNEVVGGEYPALDWLERVYGGY